MSDKRNMSDLIAYCDQWVREHKHFSNWTTEGYCIGNGYYEDNTTYKDGQIESYEITITLNNLRDAFNSLGIDFQEILKECDYVKIILNPDKDLVADIRKRLKENGGYCPCSLIKNEDTKCTCKEFREMTEGECHCGLYIKVINENRKD